MKQTLISIITVVYNGEKYIESTIKSLINQNYKNVEYIIIDGKSEDGTLKIINNYKDNINLLISEKDKGIYDAMNKGIKIAKGNIIGLLNCSDIYSSDKILNKVAYTFENNNVDIMYGDLKYIDNNDKITNRFWKSSLYKENNFLKGWTPPPPTFFIKKSIYEKYGYFKIQYQVAADFELMLRFLEFYKIKNFYFPETLIYMRIGGASNKSFSSIISQNIEIYRILKSYKINKNYFIYFFNKTLFKFNQYLKGIWSKLFSKEYFHFY